VATLNDLAWKQVFSSLPVLEQVKKFGYFDITASDLKKAADREPRHLAKIDYESNRPQVFVENQLNVLAISNSSYRIGSFNPFFKLPDWNLESTKPVSLQTSANLETLSKREISSENAVIYSAYSSNMIEHFCGEEVVPTVSGRMRTSKFSFSVDIYEHKAQQIEVNGAQIELDAGFEGKDSFSIFEVKNSISSSFNLRQVYYPFAMWKSVIKKPVRNIFLTHSNNYFDFYEIDFLVDLNLSSASLIKHVRYTLGTNVPNKSEFEKALQELSFMSPSGVPFPQADDFDKVIDIVALLIEGPKTKNELAENYDFDPRQSDYYLNAARYLGLVESSGDATYRPSELAIAIYSKSAQEKNAFLMAMLSKVPAVNQLNKAWATDGKKSSLTKAIEILENLPDSAELKPSTVKRRAQTVMSWTLWLRTQLTLSQISKVI
jgi:hypothetical protein